MQQVFFSEAFMIRPGRK